MFSTSEPSADEIVVDAQPTPFTLSVSRTALVVIDMQRDFLLPGGFGETLGNDVGSSRRSSNHWPPSSPRPGRSA